MESSLNREYLITEAVFQRIHFLFRVYIWSIVTFPSPTQYSHSKKFHFITFAQWNVSLCLMICMFESIELLALHEEIRPKHRKTLCIRRIATEIVSVEPLTNDFYCVWEMELEFVAKKLVRAAVRIELFIGDNIAVRCEKHQLHANTSCLDFYYISIYAYTFYVNWIVCCYWHRNRCDRLATINKFGGNAFNRIGIQCFIADLQH